MTDLPGWAVGFVVACVVALVGTPLARRVAVSSAFVDKPALHKSHHQPIAYLGGLAIMAATIIGTATRVSAEGRIATVLLVGTGLGIVGLVDDHQELSPRLRIGLEVLGGIVVHLAGVTWHVTNVPVLDIGATVVWVVLIVNATNLIDNMDGLSSTVASVTLAGVALLAIGASRPGLAAAGAAAAGACVGFLAWNGRPATIFMGDAGSLFLGTLCAALSIVAVAGRPAPVEALGPVLLSGVALLDCATVTFARLRHGRRVTRGGKDHLSHRLVATGLSPGWAVGTLAAVQVGLAGLVVAMAEGALPPLAAAALALVTLGALSRRTLRPTIYREPVVGLPRGVRLALLNIAVLLAFVVVPPTVALQLAKSDGEGAAVHAKRAIAALRRGDPVAAERELDQAEAGFERARRTLSSPIAALGPVAPFVAPTFRTATDVVEVGVDLAGAGDVLVAAADLRTLGLRDGRLPVAELGALEAPLRQAAELVERSSERISGTPGQGLVDVARRGRDDLAAQLDQVSAETELAARAAAVLPAVFGGSSPRRYLLVIQNPTEARGTGGLLGQFGELLVDDGKLALGPVQPVADLNPVPGSPPRTVDAPPDFLARYERQDLLSRWQLVNLSPDLPTVASVMAQLYVQAGHDPVDGVLLIDAAGLAAMLRVTGPVRVPDWPQPLSARNVEEVLLDDSYGAFEREADRHRFQSAVAAAAFDRLTSTSRGTPKRLVKALAEAVRGRHLQAWMAAPAEQDVVRDAGLSGALPDLYGDSLLLVSLNQSASKLDWYLRRSATYRATLTPTDDGQSVDVSAEAGVVLANEADPAEIVDYVAGLDRGYGRGANDTELALFTPLSLEGGSIDGIDTGLGTEPEAGRQVVSTHTVVPPGGKRTVTARLSGRVATVDGWYRLVIGRQPLVAADRVRVDLGPGAGWRIVAARGLTLRDGRAVGTLEVDRQRTVWVRLEGASTG